MSKFREKNRDILYVIYQISIILFAELAVIRIKVIFDILPNYQKFWGRVAGRSLIY